MTRASTAQSRLSRALSTYSSARADALLAARRELGVGELDARALLFIVDNPGVRPTALRDYLGVTAAGVTTLVDRLIERGVVRRDADPNDRRSNHITATVDMTEQPWNALVRFDSALDEAIAERNDPQSDALADLLAQLTEDASALQR
jgi:DNA-binding MarR family transcriptional regulator